MLLVIFTALWRTASANNVDVESPLIIKGSQQGSLFGYTAMIHRLSDQEHVYLVGAPKANTSQNLVGPGAVFKCRGQFGELKTNVACAEEDWLSVFDGTGDSQIVLPTLDGSNETKSTESKSGQFLGVALTRTNSSVIVCANQYKDHYGRKNYRVDRRLPIGRCSAISLELDEHQGYMYPCKDVADSHDSYGSCQAGTSVAHNGKQLSISAPNANNGLGNSFLYKDGADTSNRDILELITDTWKGSSVTVEKPNALSIDYAGYSTVFCDMNGDGVKELVLGMPRADSYRGSIRIHIGSLEDQNKILEDEFISNEFLRLVESRTYGKHRDTDQFENLGILCPSGHPDYDCAEPKGDHMGSYFGHTMTCSDLNGDGMDDLVISAPYHSDLRNLKNDIGQVNVYFGAEINYSDYPFPNFAGRENKTLYGNKRDAGLFGYSLNSEGDLNFDGIKDLIVGAPYEDEGRGAVYIFNGGSDFFVTYSQRITPLLLKELDMRGFGSAISSGFNIDDQGGDELLVGSFLSDTVVSMRTIPTIEITPKLMLIHKVVNLEVSKFLDPAGSEKKFVGNTLHINISTIGLQIPNNTLQLNWKLKIDPINIDPIDKRAFFNLHENPHMLYIVTGSVILEANKEVRLGTIVNVLLKRETIRDTKNLHIDIEGSLEAAKNPDNFSSKQALNFEMFRQARTTIVIDTMCNQDTGVCSSDVGITRFETELVPAGLYPHLVINKIEYINVFVTLENKGPDLAYDTVFTLNLPVELDLKSATDLHGVACAEGNYLYTVECRVDGTFDVGTRDIKIELFVDSEELSHKEILELRGNVTVGNPSNDPDLTDNVVKVTLQSFFLADIKLKGGPNKAIQPFMNKLLPDFTGPKTWEDIGPEVKHSLSVSVEELIDVEGVTDIELNIRWPLKKNRQYVLYLTEIYIPQQYQDMISCEQKYVNQLRLASGTSPSSNTSSSSSTSSSSPDSDPDPELQEVSLIGYGEDASYDCTKESCYVVKCFIPALRRGSYNHSRVKIEMRSRLWESTFKNNFRVNVTSYSRIEAVGGDLILPVLKARTRAITSKFFLPNERKGLNLWVIVLSALAGLVVVAIIILVLWRKGFFKSTYFNRNRTPSNLFQTATRRETMNRAAYS